VSATDWARRLRCQDVGVLVGEWPPPGQRDRRTVAVCDVVGTAAVVLGSGQREEDVDEAAVAGSGRSLVRRASGGGAVLVGPGGQAWVEVWLPRDDPLWDDDVVRSSWWFGEAWSRALASLGVHGCEVHRDRAVHGAWSDVVCFAGVGPGEVSVGGRKVVGVSQRRTRDGARFQSMAQLQWAPEALLAVLAGEARHERDPGELASCAVGLAELLAPGTGEDGGLGQRVGDAVFDALP
jgi:lipoate-protein ligase A